MKINYPETKRTPVIKTVGGISFEDPYPWLHDETPEALAWQAKQNELAQQVVRSWPEFDRLLGWIEAEFHSMDEADERVPAQVGGKWFRIAKTADGAADAIYVSDALENFGRPLVDTAALSAERSDGRPVFFHSFQPSPDGRLVSFLTLVGGDPQGDLRVVETETGRLLPVRAPFPRHIGQAWCWVGGAAGILAPGWAKDGRHRLQFVPVAEAEESRPDKVFEPHEVPLNIPTLGLHPAPGGRMVLAVTGPHEHTALMLGNLAEGSWRSFLPGDFSGECHGEWLHETTYIAIDTSSTPRGRVVAIPVKTSADPSTWRELVPESDAVMRNLTVIQDRLVLVDLKNVAMRVRLFLMDGTPDGEVSLPPFGSSHLLFPPRRFPRSAALIFRFGGFTALETMYRYDFATHRSEMIGRPGKELPGLHVSQRFAVSKDGTRVPYFMVHRRDLDLSQPQPTLVYGYGGYGAALLPSYLGHLVPFIQSGGIFIQANLRGGGEFGKEWYEGGRLEHKQNTHDDLYAVTEDLIAAGISTPQKLAFQGASNGGMLAGVAITQRPDLWKVVVPLVPILDLMEPTNASGMGAPGVPYQEEDYGKLDDPEAVRHIFTYSPYHNIKDGVAYPSVCVVQGDKDSACAPFHGRRFVARLQAASTSGNPILQRVWKDVSHGALGRDAIEQAAEWLGFIMQQLGMTMRAQD